MTFEDNLKYRDDVPFVAYCNSETTTTSGAALDWKNTEMFAISYVIIFAFHPDVNLDRIIIERSFAHSLKKLIDVIYLKQDMITYADTTSMQQLKDCAKKNTNKQSQKCL